MSEPNEQSDHPPDLHAVTCPRCGYGTIVLRPDGEPAPATAVHLCGACGFSRHPLPPITPDFSERVRRN